MFDKLKALILRANAFVDGYKTYGTAIAGILTSAVAWAQGTIDTQAFFLALWTGLMFIFNRMGVTKSGPK